MLGVRIADLRRYRGMTQQALADALHISASAVGMYEQGRREPPVSVLVQLSEILGVSTDFLLTGNLSDHRDAEAAKALFLNAERTMGTLYLCSANGARVLFSRKELALLFAAALADEKD